mmetsp:Transcript_8734/g.20602  ORF Transcript_8734/g.20602 Transcript_8734/m.20602 type:complete len:203 (+) Transcript_8734:117-725(+)
MPGLLLQQCLHTLRRPSTQRIACQCTHHCNAKLPGEGIGESRQRVVAYGRHKLRHLAAGEGGPAHEPFIQDATDTPNIECCGGSCVVEGLGGSVAQGSNELVWCCDAGCTHISDQTKINELDVQLRFGQEHNVGGVDITVDETHRMQCMECIENLNTHLHCVLQRKGCDSILQGFARHELHDDEGDARSKLVAFHHACDARV